MKGRPVSYQFQSLTEEVFNIAMKQLGEIAKNTLEQNTMAQVTVPAPVNQLDWYSDKLSKVKFYSSGYKMNFGHYITGGSLDENIIGTDIMHIAHHKMPETRGYTSVRGSNFFDTTVHALLEDYNPMPYESFVDSDSGYFIKDVFYQPDAKAARMFLFINCISCSM